MIVFEYYEATDSNYENMIQDVDTYILYFVGDNKASLQISSLIDIYIQAGYTVYSPVIFALKDNASSIYKKYDISEGPALFYKTTDSEVSASGYQECYDLINKIVVTANSLIEDQE